MISRFRNVEQDVYMGTIPSRFLFLKQKNPKNSAAQLGLFLRLFIFLLRQGAYRQYQTSKLFLDGINFFSVRWVCTLLILRIYAAVIIANLQTGGLV